VRHLRHILLAVSLSACPPRDLATMPTAVAPDVPPSPRMPELGSLDDWQNYVDTLAIVLDNDGLGVAAENEALRAAQEVG
jgi:hypothetical protein